MWILWTALYVAVALWCMRFMYRTWGQRHIKASRHGLNEDEALWGSVLTGVFWPVMLPVYGIAVYGIAVFAKSWALGPPRK